jgi:hypothetical protein
MVARAGREVPDRGDMRPRTGWAPTRGASPAAAGRSSGPENLDLADQAASDAERHGRYQQAAQALSSARRIVSGLAGAIAPAEPRPGPVIN